jgi:peptidoglycan/LPS O-acetylase OafA/YrhL
MQSPPRSYFPSVDILRGFAALSVVVYHIIEIFGWKSFPIDGLLVWFRIGWMGVDLFFVISGLVIGLSAMAEIDQHGTAAFRLPFFRRRFARIAPLYFFTSLAFLALVMPQSFLDLTRGNFLSHLFFVHNWFPQFHGAINGANWSLGVEMQFYLLMLWLAPRLRERGGWAWLLALVLVAWGWRYGCTLVLASPNGDNASALFHYSTQLPGTLDEFAAGLLLARLIRSRMGAAVLQANPLWSLLAATVLVWGAMTVFWGYTYWDKAAMVVFCRALIALAMGAVVLVACALNHPLWLKLTTPLRYLGTISYGIYLWHLLVLKTFADIAGLDAQHALFPVLLLTLALASASWHFFEKPFVQRLSARAA